MRAMAIAAVGAALVIASASAAAADAVDPSSGGTGGFFSSEEGRQITSMDIAYDLQGDGSAQVTMSFTFDFGNDPGHGPYLKLVTREPFDDAYDRVYAVSDVEAFSPSGAPDDLNLEQSDTMLTIRIGDPDIDDVDGAQQYVVSYTIADVVNEVTVSAPGDSLDGFEGNEFYWNVLGTDWAVPISAIAVRVTAPVTPTDAHCYAGVVQLAMSCESAKVIDSTARFSHPYLFAGEALTVGVLYPQGHL